MSASVSDDVNLCRLCLTDDGVMYPIFIDGKYDLVQKIFDCTSIQVEQIAGVPSSICEVCKSKLVICSQFIRQCVKTDAEIKHIYAKNYDLHQLNFVRNGATIESQQKFANAEIEIIDVPCSNSDLQTNELIVNAREDDGSIVFEIIEQSQSDKTDELCEKTIVELSTVADDEEKHDTVPKIIISPVQRKVSSDAQKPKVNRGIRRKTFGKNKKVQNNSEFVDSKSSIKKYKKECPVCHVPQQNLKQHMDVHSGIKKHVCQFCNKAFAQRGNLTCHLNIHTGNKPHKCEQCGKSFGDPTSLKSHKINHTDETIFQCDICNKKFKYRHSLRTHIRSHNDDRRHACTFCSMAFVTSSSLKKHVRKHTGERPYKCEQCFKSFSTSFNLKTHKKVHAKNPQTRLKDSNTTVQKS
ncbi:zinc finger protein 771-like [Malaya genurostris]|uniref:zinc finger protein 771-like n=1 Tax=Malaya genurostris TaxID=325434 RepID=UPI0026F384DA|nr:zinc finger protein 771-like [Malaya genurostris]